MQYISAGGEPDKTQAPLNAAQDIAAHLAWEGRYEGGNWVRLKGVVRPQDPPLRAFNLPGYAWYAAVMWRAFPRAHRYIQIPVVVLLTVSVAWFAAILGGPLLGLVAGLIAALDPFMVVHGPVWDDAVFGTALLWTIFAIAAHRWRHAAAPSRWPELMLLAGLAALAAVTRTEAQVLLLGLAIYIWLFPTLRPLRRMSLAAAVGVVLAVTAWGVRNQHAIGEFLTTSTHDGITLWESNGPLARRALALGQVDRLSEDSTVMRAYWAPTQTLTEAGADAYFRHAATRYIRSHPIDVLETSLAKLAVSVTGVRPEKPLSDRRNLASIIDDAALAALAFTGLVRRFRLLPRQSRMTALGLLLPLAGVMLGFLLIGPAGIRYWLTLRALIWILAAAAIC
jgi:hypothetical protein